MAEKKIEMKKKIDRITIYADDGTLLLDAHPDNAFVVATYTTDEEHFAVYAGRSIDKSSGQRLLKFGEILGEQGAEALKQCVVGGLFDELLKDDEEEDEE